MPLCICSPIVCRPIGFWEQVTDNYGMEARRYAPLHLAAYHGAPLDVVLALVAACPGARYIETQGYECGQLLEPRTSRRMRVRKAIAL